MLGLNLPFLQISFKLLKFIIPLMILVYRCKKQGANDGTAKPWQWKLIEPILWPGSIFCGFVTCIGTHHLPSQNQFCCCAVPESWQPCYNPSPDACILGGGTVTLAQRTQNGFRKILQVLILTKLVIYTSQLQFLCFSYHIGARI